MNPNHQLPAQLTTEPGAPHRQAVQAEVDIANGTEHQELVARIAELIQTARFEWRVTFQREGWKATSTKTRIWQSKSQAQRYVAHLKADDSQAPIVTLTVQRRPVGRWEQFTVVIGDEVGASEVGQ